ncbi:MAG: electron transfer flavoprotein subunit beta/FixA family protein [Lentisphaeria bacterium]|nr:electron transfer flavoprotein subunit beta/FixA family protein [Lentisphaeria bacterium]
MRIAVCIKQVPDTTELRLDPETNTLLREGAAAVLNPLDEFPLAAACQLKEQTGGTVTAFTMGPPAAEDVLRTAVAMGADDGVLISDRVFAGADTWATSLVLARALEYQGGFDVILCGKQAVDGDTAQVGPGIAAHLNIPQVTYVTSLEPGETGRTVIVERLLDDQRVRLEVTTPVMLTVLKEYGEPRLPSLPARLAALTAVPARLDAAALGFKPEEVGLKGSFTRVARVDTPKAARALTMLTGTTEDVARQLAAILRQP